MFGFVEIGIGAFGVVSIPLFHAVGALTLGASPFVTAIVTFLLTLCPTVLSDDRLTSVVIEFFDTRTAHGALASSLERTSRVIGANAIHTVR